MRAFIFVKDLPAVRQAIEPYPHRSLGVHGQWFLLSTKDKNLVELARSSPEARVLPRLRTSVQRLPANIQTIIGNIAPDAITIYDVLMDLVGVEDLLEEWD